MLGLFIIIDEKTAWAYPYRYSFIENGGGRGAAEGEEEKEKKEKRRRTLWVVVSGFRQCSAFENVGRIGVRCPICHKRLVETPGSPRGREKRYKAILSNHNEASIDIPHRYRPDTPIKSAATFNDPGLSVCRV
jgi:hypothetical protein